MRISGAECIPDVMVGIGRIDGEAIFWFYDWFSGEFLTCRVSGAFLVLGGAFLASHFSDAFLVL